MVQANAFCPKSRQFENWTVFGCPKLGENKSLRICLPESITPINVHTYSECLNSKRPNTGNAEIRMQPNSDFGQVFGHLNQTRPFQTFPMF